MMRFLPVDSATFLDSKLRFKSSFLSGVATLEQSPTPQQNLIS